MRFSERKGLVSAKKIIQIESIDTELKNGLWNIFDFSYFIEVQKTYWEDSLNKGLILQIWHNFWKKTIDSIPIRTNSVKKEIKSWFFNANWYEIYDFIEYCTENDNFDSETIRNTYNTILERENSAYRFVNGIISQITEEVEIEEIDEAISSANSNGFIGVKEHLRKSLTLLSDKTSPDYRNSIKESISAVESICKIISSSSKNTLGSALDKIKGKLSIHPALERAFKQLYGYTSDEDGIRHAIIEESDCNFEDAKFMLVSCSAFINYLIFKIDRAGILEK